MPDTRSHRGPRPEDAELFSEPQWPALRSATADLCWLLDRGYAIRSALALTGDRYALTARQRIAVARCSCSQVQYERRSAKELRPPALAGEDVWIDGYNLLITIESALGRGTLLRGRDRCCRDMASQHGTYREVAETLRAAELIGASFASWGVSKCRWLLDRPVGNSARLRTTLLEVAAKAGWNWEVELDVSPDRTLSEARAIIASSDSNVLDRCGRWVNAASAILATQVPDAFVLDLWCSPESPAEPGQPK